MTEKSTEEQIAARQWALEQAVKIADPENVTSGWVIRVADEFHKYVENGTVPR